MTLATNPVLFSCLVFLSHTLVLLYSNHLTLRKAKEAITQHVDLAKSLGDHAAQSKVRACPGVELGLVYTCSPSPQGYQVLGCFASAQRDYEQAIDCFEVCLDACSSYSGNPRVRKRTTAHSD